MPAGELKLLAAYALTSAAGFTAVSAALRGETAAFRLFLAPGLGFAVTSAFLFLELALFSRFLPAVTAGVLLVLAAACFILNRGAYRKARFSRADAFVFAVAFLAAVLFALQAAKSPFGSGLDAWAIWKLKARFLFYADDWRTLFSPALGFSHPDYPLFYPLSLVWGWLAAGRETPLAPVLFALIFTAAPAGLVAAAFPGEGRKAAAAGLLLVSTPHFIGAGASQYADILVAYFGAASVILAAGAFRERSARWALLAGVFAGANCFVKNEGILFLAAFTFAVACRTLIRRSFRGDFRLLAAAAAGAAPFLLVTALFKLLADYPNQHLSVEAMGAVWRSGAMGERLATVLRHVAVEIFEENSWVYAWFCVLVPPLLYVKRYSSAGSRWIFLALAVIAAGHAFLYTFGPMDPGTHLEASLDRLMLQAFPIAVYACVKDAPFLERQNGQGNGRIIPIS